MPVIPRKYMAKKPMATARKEAASEAVSYGKSRAAAMRDKIKKLVKEGKPQDQAVAIAHSMRRSGDL